MYKFISIGGWCGSTIGLRGNKLYDQALPFDHVRSTFEGIIDCFENGFQNFFPKKIEVDVIENYPYSGLSFRGKYFGFYHHNLLDPKVMDDFSRRIERLYKLLDEENNKIVFIRTVSKDDYEEETRLADKFLNLLELKCKSNFILVFIIPGQSQTLYYKNLNKKTFIFTLNDKSGKNENLPAEYKPIYDFILQEDLFNNTPVSNNLNIEKGKNRYLDLSGVPTIREDN